ncbi:ribonuclease P [Babesia ovis]|uniref:Ribonuclease P n=1 Tax=Babesia ovis TaxID=5869 RepID=A0A9W5T7G9_BABOV|nr:ribonuclease P [Babesia ovis]
MIDLNIPWTPTSDAKAWLSATRSHGWDSLGFNVYLSADTTGVHDIAIKGLPESPESTGTSVAVVTTLGRPSPAGSTVIRRVTIVLYDGFQPNSVNKIIDSRDYDIVALMPTTQKSFHTACEVLNCDLINLDYFCHYAQFKVKRGMVTAALHRGCFFEVTMSTLDHIESLADTSNRSASDISRLFRAQLAKVLNYIPLKRLVLSPGHLHPSSIVDPQTFIGMCNELLCRATGEICNTRACITTAPKGCIAKGAVRRTYGTGIVVHMSGEQLGNRFSAITKT